MATLHLTFEYAKSTKNTECYSEKPEPGKPPVIGSIYVAKWAANGAQSVTVTIEIPDK